MGERLELAELVCREARYQMAQHGGICDNERLARFIIQWLSVADENKYSRPIEQESPVEVVQ